MGTLKIELPGGSGDAVDTARLMVVISRALILERQKQLVEIEAALATAKATLNRVRRERDERLASRTR